MSRYFIEYWTTEDGHLLYLVLIDSIEIHESQDLAEHFGGTTRSRKIRKFINRKKDLSYLKAQAKQLRGSLLKSGPLDFATKNTFPLFLVTEEALVGIY